MKKIVLFFLPVVFFFFAFQVKAQMMGGWRLNNFSSSNCQQDDQYFEKLGDQLMKQMMGEKQDELMEKQMGEELSRLMHIRMGKMLSGCLSGLNQGGFGMMGYPMMGGWMSGWGGFYSWYFFLIQILVVLILILLIVYLWKKIKN